jgi:hypothetical protein
MYHKVNTLPNSSDYLKGIHEAEDAFINYVRLLNLQTSTLSSSAKKSDGNKKKGKQAKNS